MQIDDSRLSLLFCLASARYLASPTDEETIADRATEISFHGVAGAPSSMVSVQARHPTVGTWDTLATVTSASSPTPWRGLHLYSWSAGALKVPEEYWRSDGGSFQAQVRSVSGDNHPIYALEPDWTTVRAR